MSCEVFGHGNLSRGYPVNQVLSWLTRKTLIWYHWPDISHGLRAIFACALLYKRFFRIINILANS